MDKKNCDCGNEIVIKLGGEVRFPGKITIFRAGEEMGTYNGTENKEIYIPIFIEPFTNMDQYIASGMFVEIEKASDSAYKIHINADTDIPAMFLNDSDKIMSILIYCYSADGTSTKINKILSVQPGSMVMFRKMVVNATATRTIVNSIDQLFQIDWENGIYKDNSGETSTYYDNVGSVVHSSLLNAIAKNGEMYYQNRKGYYNLYIDSLENGITAFRNNMLATGTINVKFSNLRGDNGADDDIVPYDFDGDRFCAVIKTDTELRIIGMRHMYIKDLANPDSKTVVTEIATKNDLENLAGRMSVLEKKAEKNVPIVLDGEAETIEWDASEHSNAIVTILDKKTLHITNAEPGQMLILQCYGNDIDFSGEEYCVSENMQYVFSDVYNHWIYSLYYNGKTFDVSGQPAAGGAYE